MLPVGSMANLIIMSKEAFDMRRRRGTGGTIINYDVGRDEDVQLCDEPGGCTCCRARARKSGLVLPS
jgi:hypothetical protein